MALQNRIAVSGRLAADPETRTTPGGVQVRNAPLYVGQGRDRDGTDKPTIKLRLTAWEPRDGEGGDDNAFVVLSGATKGQMVTVEGRLTLQAYRGQDGADREQLGITADLARVEAGPGHGTSRQGQNSSHSPPAVERRPSRPPPNPRDHRPLPAAVTPDIDDEIPF